MTLKHEAPTSPSELKPLLNPICFIFHEHAEHQKVLPLLCWAGQADYEDSEVCAMEGFCRGSCFFARLCKQQVQTLSGLCSRAGPERGLGQPQDIGSHTSRGAAAGHGSTVQSEQLRDTPDSAGTWGPSAGQDSSHLVM